MKCNQKNIQKNRAENTLLEQAEVHISLALLTADDLFCLTEKDREYFINGYATNLSGYASQRLGIKEIREELADRGIEVCILKRPDFTDEIPQRKGRGEWVIEIDEETNKKTIYCSRCKTKTATQPDFCCKCGADMRRSKYAKQQLKNR